MQVFEQYGQYNHFKRRTNRQVVFLLVSPAALFSSFSARWTHRSLYMMDQTRAGSFKHKDVFIVRNNVFIMYSVIMYNVSIMYSSITRQFSNTFFHMNQMNCLLLKVASTARAFSVLSMLLRCSYTPSTVNPSLSVPSRLSPIGISLTYMRHLPGSRPSGRFLTSGSIPTNNFSSHRAAISFIAYTFRGI